MRMSYTVARVKVKLVTRRHIQLLSDRKMGGLGLIRELAYVSMMMNPWIFYRLMQL